ncbi:hypothetical protein [Sinomonas atrocyanea]
MTQHYFATRTPDARAATASGRRPDADDRPIPPGGGLQFDDGGSDGFELVGEAVVADVGQVRVPAAWTPGAWP